jgi:hypothetical protein
MQGCFDGTASERDVGRCTSGTQSEVLVPEGPDATPTPEWGPCEGALGPTQETCNGVDDDCNGAIDDGPAECCNLADDDCDVTIDEDTACAGDGMFWTRFWSPSPAGVLPPTASLYRRASDAALGVAPCMGATIPLETAHRVLMCVAAPPTDCADGTRAEWVGGGWVCVPCGVVVQTGAAQFFERRCEALPGFECADATEITLHDETWRCVFGCTSDAVATFVDGRKLCVAP